MSEFLKCVARGSLKIQDTKNRHAHHRTNLSGYIFATNAPIDNRRKLLNSNISSTCPHNMVNFGPFAAEIGWWVWSTQQISTGFASWLRYCIDVARRRSTKFCTMFGRLLGWYTVCAFSGALAPNGIPPGAKFNLRSSLAFSYILAFGSVTARHSSSGRQPNFAAYYLHTKGRPYRSTLGGRTV